MSKHIWDQNVDHVGWVKVQEISTLPGSTSAADERKIIYTADTKQMYISDGSSWTLIGGATQVHNALSSIQGGSALERYHLTADKVGSLANVTTTDPALAASVFDWGYDSGWFAAPLSSATTTIVHSLGTSLFTSIVVQMRDGNNIPINYAGGAHEGVREDQNRAWGYLITHSDTNTAELRMTQDSIAKYWRSPFSTPTGWVSNQPTELRVLFKV